MLHLVHCLTRASCATRPQSHPAPPPLRRAPLRSCCRALSARRRTASCRISDWTFSRCAAFVGAMICERAVLTITPCSFWSASRRFWAADRVREDERSREGGEAEK